VAATVEATILEPGVEPAMVAPAADADRHPHRKSIAIAALGYVTISTILLVVGMLLTHPLAHSVGGWDEHVNRYLADRRTAFGNDITSVATAAFNTVPVVIASALLVAFLLLRRHAREAAFITLALLLEITTFLSATFVVGRPRPDVVRLNSTPATSSFPSGHTAAATVLFVGIAVIVACCSGRRVARAASVVLAIVVVAAVGFARVYRGLHHPTDVIAGMLFGLACLVVAGLALRAHGDAWRARSEDAPERRERQPEDALQR
jgi:undecaprenyl-diphosphatase